MRGVTVGGTSFAALRPGFLRGGRTQVLLKASLLMTSGWRSFVGVGGDACEGEEKDRRGARGAVSDGPMAACAGDDMAAVKMCLGRARRTSAWQMSMMKRCSEWSDLLPHHVSR